MAELQGIVTFPGVENPIRATYTRSQGVSPGVCTLEMVPQQRPINSPNATLRFFFGDTTLEFRECMIDTASLAVDGGGYITSLNIFDRRWKWTFGGVFGEYNRRDAEGKVVPDTEQTPYGLAKKLLAAMYEPLDEALKLPEKGRPYVKWEGANPARELESLCQQLGYFVTLDIDDKLRIVKQGEGQELPDNPLVMQYGTSLNPPEKPDKLTIYGAPTRFQAWFYLEPVGLDIDGSTKPIDELSYKPADGWEKEPSTFPNLRFANATVDQQTALRNAIATVWRWFRIYLDDGSHALNLPPELGLPPVTDRKQVLPISSDLVQTEKVDGVVRRKQAKVFGLYVKGTAGEKFNSDEEPNLLTTPRSYTQLTTNKKNIPYLGDFTINEQFGIVEFPVQVLRWLRAGGASEWQAPELYLQCSFNLQDLKTGAQWRYAYNFDTGAPQFNTGAEMIPATDQLQSQQYQIISPERREPVWLHVIGREPSDLDEDANKIALAAMSRYQNVVTGDAAYAGLLRINPDGAIRQVTWEVGPSGAMTRASRNCETAPHVPKFRERQLMENMAALVVDSKAKRPSVPEVT